MPRKKLIAGNWKMYMLAESARDLARTVVQGVPPSETVEVALCVPFPWLVTVAEVLKGTHVALGAQNVNAAKEGAYTGEVSAGMLLDVGCKYVIIAHSERRHGLREPDYQLNLKVRSALAAGLMVIYCIGETLVEREAKQTEEILDWHLVTGLHKVPAAQMANLVIAYEPVWAIGTGKVATTEQAQSAHLHIRNQVAQLFTPEIAQSLIIQYGGSVKADNAAELLSQPDIDGALVGGASLKGELFLPIVKAAQ